MITSLGLKAKTRPNKHKKARYAIKNVSKKDLSNIIREFDKLTYKSYERRRPNNEPTDSYFYLARHIGKCMMIADAHNLDNYLVKTKMTATKQIPILHVCCKYEINLKEFIFDKNLSQIYSTDEDESKLILVDKCSTNKHESECVHKNINKKMDAENEAEYEESSVTYEVLRYFNIFECGRNTLNRLDMTYKQACMENRKKILYDSGGNSN